MSELSLAIITLIEYHNRPTALGHFRRADRAGFYLQQLPLNEVEFAILMSDFFVTFGVSSEHYEEARYFPAHKARRFAPARGFRAGAAKAGYPLTVALLCEAARSGVWPAADD